MNLARWCTLGLSRLAGVLAQLRAPRALRALIWGVFARAYGIRADEAAKPLADYPTFLALFTRRLRPGARPLDDGPWVSPVDALWLADEPLDGDVFVPVKGNEHRLGELLADDNAAATFAGGRIATFYLRPGDYHRIHSPCAWTVERQQRVDGVLWPVNRLGQRVPGLFGKNERWIFRGNGPAGPVAMVWVGALMVGSMAVYHERLAALIAGGPPADLAPGDELGAFHFGSTVIVVSAGPWVAAAATPCEIQVGQTFWSMP